MLAFGEPPGHLLRTFENLHLAHRPSCLLVVNARLLFRTRGYGGRVLPRDLDELVSGPGREPRPASPALDGWRAIRRSPIAGTAPVDHDPDPRVALMTTSQMLVERRLIPCDDDQIAHRELSCRLAGTGRGAGEISDDLPKQRAQEKHGHCRVVTTSPTQDPGQARLYHPRSGRFKREVNGGLKAGRLRVDTRYQRRARRKKKVEIGRASCR